MSDEVGWHDTLLFVVTFVAALLVAAGVFALATWIGTTFD